jgi:hypothetical protein
MVSSACSDEPVPMLRSVATNYFPADGLGSVTSLSNWSQDGNYDFRKVRRGAASHARFQN